MKIIYIFYIYILILCYNNIYAHNFHVCSFLSIVHKKDNNLNIKQDSHNVKNKSRIIKKNKDNISKEENDNIKTNIAHNKSNKINVSDNIEYDIKDDEMVIKKQTQFINTQQMVLSIVSMILSRYIFKIDYKKNDMVLKCRLIFCSYLIFSQLLYSFLSWQISKKDDRTVLTLQSTLSGESNPMLNIANLLTRSGTSQPSSMFSNIANMMKAGGTDNKLGKDKLMTVKQHDLNEIKKLSSSLLFEVLGATYVHFVNKNCAPLLLIPMMGVTNKLKAPIILLHLFKLKAIGTLQRPFKTPFETMISSMTSNLNPTTHNNITTSSTSILEGSIDEDIDDSNIDNIDITKDSNDITEIVEETDEEIEDEIEDVHIDGESSENNAPSNSNDNNIDDDDVNDQQDNIDIDLENEDNNNNNEVNEDDDFNDIDKENIDDNDNVLNKIDDMKI